MRPTNRPPAENSLLNRREFCARSLAAAIAGVALPVVGQLATDPQPAVAKPGRRWELFVVQHSHIDLGFTDRQEVIADYHRQFVRQAIEMALSPAQESRSPDCRFKYTIEGFWSLEQFLRSASAKERRALIRALKSGVLELTAGYFHLTELLDTEVLRSTLQPAQRFARREGLHVETCMSCDVNGFSWAFSDLLIDAGVRYLSTNINVHHGGVPLGGPLKPFYWEAPSGRRLLAWNGLAYHRANVLGLMGYYAPDTDLGFPGVKVPAKHGYHEIRDIRFAEGKLLPTLAHLEAMDYPYDFLPLMGNAVYTDNGPAGDQYCDIIREWNAVHGEQVHIRTATLAEFFKHVEQRVSSIPTYRGEWTDWWSEGVAATPMDTLLFRNAQRTRHLVTRLDAGHRVVSAERIEEIDRRLALYAEHTFGYSNTASHSLLTHQVFARKTAHAIQADELAGQALVEVLRHRGEGEFCARRPFRYKVINPLDRPVRAAVQLPIDYWEEPFIAQGARVIGPDGGSLPCQIEPAPRGKVIVTQVELAPGAELDLRVEKGSRSNPPPEDSKGFTNAYYRVAWDEEHGIFSLVDAVSGRELLKAGGGGLGCPVYQVFPGGNRGSAAGFGFTARTIPQDKVTVGKCMGARRVSTGEVCERWELPYEVPGTKSYVVAATFYRGLPQIELAARVEKTDVMDPEGLYALFPFELEGGVWHLDKPGGPIRPGLDQLPGSCCDYYCVQAGAALVAKGGGIALTILDAPMVQLGKLRLWNYSTSIEPTGPLYSWLTNNKWDTNFRLTCGGRYEFRYVVQVLPGGGGEGVQGVEVCKGNAVGVVVVRG